MNKVTIFAALILVLSGVIGASPFIIDETSVKVHQQSFKANATVLDADSNSTTLGMNADPNLEFGKLPQNSNVTKFINVSVAEKSYLSISSEGNISRMLEYDDRMYFEGSKEIPVEVRGREPGNYTGTVELRFQVPENRIGGYWLDLKYRLHSIL